MEQILRNNSFIILLFEANILENTPDNFDVKSGGSRGRLGGSLPPRGVFTRRASEGDRSAFLSAFAAAAAISTSVILS